MRINNDFSGGYVRYFADDAAINAARSLQFLQVIESEVEVLYADADKYDAISKVGHELADKLRNQPLERSIDTDGAIEAALHTDMDAMHTIMKRLKGGRAAARADANPLPNDGVVEAYERLISSLHQCHDTLGDVLWALTEHDVDQTSPAETIYGSADDLFAALKIG